MGFMFFFDEHHANAVKFVPRHFATSPQFDDSPSQPQQQQDQFNSVGVNLVQLLTNKGHDGTLADLWSCGVILFVLAEYLPFEDGNIASLYKMISGAQFTCPSWFSDGAKRLIA